MMMNCSDEIYVDEIILGCINKRYSDEFGYMMQEQYQMSMMGELKCSLGLQIRQQRNGIFISQEKYLKDCLKKFGMQDCKGYTMPMPTKGQLGSDDNGIDFDETFAPVARLGAIRILLVYANHNNILLYQMDVKSAFINGKLKKKCTLHN